MASKRLSILVGIGVLHYAQVRIVARLSYTLLIKSFKYGALRLVGVRAVVVAAVAPYPENLREEMAYLVLVELYGTKTTHPGGVNQPPAPGQGEHFGKCSSVHPGVVHVRNLARAQLQTWYECIDEC